MFFKGRDFWGAAQNYKRVIGITLGTGLGSAVYKEGRFFEGDLYCTPFKDGNTEDYVSTRWCTGEYWKRSGNEIANVKELSKLAGSDKTASGIFKDFGKSFGEMLADYIQKHQPEIVVIGRNIIGAWDLFIPATLEVLTSNNMEMPLVKAVLG